MELLPLRLPRRGDVTFVEAIESHRTVLEHFSFELIGQIFARVKVRQVAAELVALAFVRKVGGPHDDVRMN